jgi:hypothetical protein
LPLATAGLANIPARNPYVLVVLWRQFHSLQQFAVLVLALKLALQRVVGALELCRELVTNALQLPKVKQAR